MKKLDKKIIQFKNALDRFDEVLSPKNAIERDALVKRFEFTFDSGWKTLKSFLEQEHSKTDLQSPLQTFKAAFLVSLFSEEQVKEWTVMRDLRNGTAHEYEELLAEEVASMAQKLSNYFHALLELFPELPTSLL